MNDYTPFNNAIVVYKEATVSQIVPKSGPRAGQKTSVVEFKAYRPEFEKKPTELLKRKIRSSSLSSITAAKFRPRE